MGSRYHDNYNPQKKNQNQNQKSKQTFRLKRPVAGLVAVPRRPIKDTPAQRHLAPWSARRRAATPAATAGPGGAGGRRPRPAAATAGACAPGGGGGGEAVEAKNGRPHGPPALVAKRCRPVVGCLVGDVTVAARVQRSRRCLMAAASRLQQECVSDPPSPPPLWRKTALGSRTRVARTHHTHTHTHNQTHTRAHTHTNEERTGAGRTVGDVVGHVVLAAGDDPLAVVAGKALGVPSPVKRLQRRPDDSKPTSGALQGRPRH